MPISLDGLRFLDRTLPTIGLNLALDEALLIEADEGRSGPVLRLWEPAEFAVVLGSTSRLNNDVHVARCRSDGVAIARRSSGGGTVVVGPGCLNVAVVAPYDASPGLASIDAAQRFVLEPIVDSLRALGFAVELLGLGDLTIGLRKFAGSAQRRLRRYFLVHTSILYRFPLDRITRYTGMPQRRPAYREARPHDEFLTNLGLEREALTRAIRAAWSDPDGPAGFPEGLVHDLAATKYDDPAWIERL
jgi:lipoate-protein ligase A